MDSVEVVLKPTRQTELASDCCSTFASERRNEESKTTFSESVTATNLTHFNRIQAHNSRDCGTRAHAEWRLNSFFLSINTAKRDWLNISRNPFTRRRKDNWKVKSYAYLSREDQITPKENTRIALSYDTINTKYAIEDTLLYSLSWVWMTTRTN